MNSPNESQVIRLRAMEPEDLELLYQIENNQDLWAVGTTNVPYSRYVLHDYIANSSGDIYTDKQVRLIVEYLQQTVGIADLINFDPKHCRAEIGMVLMPSFRNKGLGRAVLNQLEQYAKSVLHIHQLYAVISTENEQVIRLFSKAGYFSGPHLKDWLYDGTHYQDALFVQRIL